MKFLLVFLRLNRILSIPKFMQFVSNFLEKPLKLFPDDGVNTFVSSSDKCSTALFVNFSSFPLIRCVVQNLWDFDTFLSVCDVGGGRQFYFSIVSRCVPPLAAFFFFSTSIFIFDFSFFITLISPLSLRLLFFLIFTFAKCYLFFENVNKFSALLNLEFSSAVVVVSHLKNVLLNHELTEKS